MSNQRPEATEQATRITFMVIGFMGEHYRGVEFSVGPNDAHDRVTVGIAKRVSVEFGPEDWVLDDDVLRARVESKIRSVIRANLPY